MFILYKTSRKGDDNKVWLFSTLEKLEAFRIKYKLEDNPEAVYEWWEGVVDPE